MIHSTGESFLKSSHRRVALFGMSGLGKTRLADLLRAGGRWFHYSVDFRIGTRYMGEHIVDNFKRHAMQNPFLRELLMSDSIYIASNITFQNLAPLSTYMGKPGDPGLGGIAFDEYLIRQRQHRTAEIAAMHDAAAFVHKAIDIYGYEHFVCDCSGSLCEVANPDDPADPVMSALSEIALPVWIEGDERHRSQLEKRFDQAPKPMYYREEFLREKWGQYLAQRGVAPEKVDPDDFIRWGFAQLLDERLPRYRALAARWGVSITAAESASVQTPQDFESLIARAIDRRAPLA